MRFEDLEIDSNGDILITGDFNSAWYAMGNGARYNSYDFGNYNVHSESSNNDHGLHL